MPPYDGHEKINQPYLTMSRKSPNNSIHTFSSQLILDKYLLSFYHDDMVSKTSLYTPRDKDIKSKVDFTNQSPTSMKLCNYPDKRILLDINRLLSTLNNISSLSIPIAPSCCRILSLFNGNIKKREIINEEYIYFNQKLTIDNLNHFNRINENKWRKNTSQVIEESQLLDINPLQKRRKFAVVWTISSLENKEEFYTLLSSVTSFNKTLTSEEFMGDVDLILLSPPNIISYSNGLILSLLFDYIYIIPPISPNSSFFINSGNQVEINASLSRHGHSSKWNKIHAFSLIEYTSVLSVDSSIIFTNADQSLYNYFIYENNNNTYNNNNNNDSNTTLVEIVGCFNTDQCIQIVVNENNKYPMQHDESLPNNSKKRALKHGSFVLEKGDDINPHCVLKSSIFAIRNLNFETYNRLLEKIISFKKSRSIGEAGFLIFPKENVSARIANLDVLGFYLSEFAINNDNMALRHVSVSSCYPVDLSSNITHRRIDEESTHLSVSKAFLNLPKRLSLDFMRYNENKYIAINFERNLVLNKVDTVHLSKLPIQLFNLNFDSIFNLKNLNKFSINLSVLSPFEEQLLQGRIDDGVIHNKNEAIRQMIIDHRFHYILQDLILNESYDYIIFIINAMIKLIGNTNIGFPYIRVKESIDDIDLFKLALKESISALFR